jgi:transposase
MQIRSVGVDLGRTTFHLVALGNNGKVLLKKKFTQKQLITFTANLQTSLIGLEARWLFLSNPRESKIS